MKNRDKYDKAWKIRKRLNYWIWETTLFKNKQVPRIFQWIKNSQWFRSVIVSVSTDVLLNKRVLVKKESLHSNILQSVLFKVLQGVFLLSLNTEICRRKWEINSILKLHVRCGFKQFWKMYLNLCSRSSRLSYVISIIPKYCHIKKNGFVRV